jgi:hypothetical protein
MAGDLNLITRLYLAEVKKSVEPYLYSLMRLQGTETNLRFYGALFFSRMICVCDLFSLIKKFYIESEEDGQPR